ncbi:MAG: coproporphyrinogen dehydrogenase HemZ [Oscillospiraceae bacterium]|nr:coproporphyrinogen dehydrogenase HemZ [Oscillospiraceae bacterium]
MDFVMKGHDLRYAVEQMLLTLFPDEKPVLVPEPGDRPCFVTELTEIGGEAEARARFLARQGEFYASRRAALPEKEKKSAAQMLVKLAIYDAAMSAGVSAPPWGALTGIRPAKLAAKRLAEGKTDAAEFLTETYAVSPVRAALAAECGAASLAADASLSPGDVSLYVGIPFCPTRCAYCSFVSHSVEKSFKLVAPYLDALFGEIAETAERVAREGLRPVTLYIGGGTPTTLTAEQLAALAAKLRECFDFSAMREFTVEAGRPDTITREKLLALRESGVTRISINPQSMDENVLRAIGRAHSPEDILSAFALAREVGFGCINADLIAGLPGDSPEGFARSLEAMLGLGAENITVHTLARKRASRMNLEKTPVPGGKEVGMMLDRARTELCAHGYKPYYLYRQKFTAGGYENVGWSLPGLENLYNICIMEELHSIISMGAGGVTKTVDRESGLITRRFNKKYPYEYIAERSGENDSK